MRRLTIGEKVFEMSEHDYYSSINNLVQGLYRLSEAYHNYHVSGFADWKGIFKMPEVGQTEVEKAIVDQIDDDELSSAYNSLREQLQEMIDLDIYIVKCLAKYVGLSSIQEKKDKAKLERRLKKIIVHGPDGHPQGPVWAMNQEYQALLERSKEIMAVMKTTREQIDRKIQQQLNFEK